MTNEQIKESLRQSIKDSYKDFAVFHSKTFDITLGKYENLGEEYDEEVGQIIAKYVDGLEMDKEQDACYIAGRIDAFEEVLSLLTKSNDIPF